jgi:SAM-dependent methyltransferase
MGSAVPGRDRAALQLSFGHHLSGEGVELGPGHSPFPLPFPGVTARYVDRWEPESNRALFPELGGAEFPKPDIVANLDTERLSALGSASQDFVIASHVLEHMANPLAQIEEIWRVLRPGGVALVLLPDRRRTFDRGRAPTPLEHLIAEYESGVDVVDDAHLEDFLRGVGEWDDTLPDDERAASFASHRDRSIHVHCWNEDEFVDVLVYSITGVDLRWELVDAAFVDDVDDSIEFGYVLQKPATPVDRAVCAERFRAVWKVLANQSATRAVRDAELRRLTDAPAGAVAPPTPGADLRRAAEAMTDALRHSRLAPAIRAVRRSVRQLRGRSTSTEPPR